MFKWLGPQQFYHLSFKKYNYENCVEVELEVIEEIMYLLQSAESEDKSLAKKPRNRSARGSGKSTVDKETKDTTMRDTVPKSKHDKKMELAKNHLWLSACTATSSKPPCPTTTTTTTNAATASTTAPGLLLYP